MKNAQNMIGTAVMDILLPFNFAPINMLFAKKT
jgi:hypothetical protein